MTSADHLKGLLGLSGGFWMIFCLYSILRIKGFIVRRYQKETHLGQTIYFSTYMPFAKHLPDFFSSGLYVAHLLHFVWFWRVVKFIKEKRPMVHNFDDINSPDEVTRHFTAKEIRLIKRPAYICIILFIHAIVFYIGRCFWPEAFS